MGNDFSFNGTTYKRENAPDAASPHLGGALEEMISRELPSAAAGQLARQAAQAAQAKRQQAEDRAIAKMLGKELKDF